MSANQLWSQARENIHTIKYYAEIHDASDIPPVETIQQMLILVRAANSLLQSLERQLVGVLPPKEG